MTTKLPNTAADGLAVFCADFLKESEIGRIYVTIIKEDEHKRTFGFEINRRNPYGVFALSEGLYIIKEIYVISQSNPNIRVAESLSLPFQIERKTVFLFPLIITTFKDSPTNTISLSGMEMNEQKKKEILSFLENKYYWPAWEIYPLVGF